MNSIDLSPTYTEDDLARIIHSVSLPGVSPWQSAQSGDYQYYSGEIDDVDHDAHDCVLNDISTSGMDLHQVRASVWQEDPGGSNWYPMLTIMMMPPADATPDEFIQWSVQLQNSLGILIVNQFEELDDDEFDGPLPSVGLWSLTSTGEVGVDLRLPGSYPDPESAAQALAPWFQDLQISVRTAAAGGEVCDEVGGSGGRSR